LHLDRELSALLRAGTVDLADRGGGEGLFLELGEVIRDLAPEVFPR